jgi:hypothetical protein
MELVNLLTSQLGLQPNQAMGGLGSLLNLAKDKLPAGDFQKVAQLIPEAGQAMTAAPKPNAAAGALGALGGMLGGKADNIASLAGLAQQFSQLGLKGDMVQKFVPIIMQFLQAKGGSGLTSLLGNVLK